MYNALLLDFVSGVFTGLTLSGLRAVPFSGWAHS